MLASVRSSDSNKYSCGMCSSRLSYAKQQLSNIRKQTHSGDNILWRID